MKNAHKQKNRFCVLCGAVIDRFNGHYCKNCQDELDSEGLQTDEEGQ